MRSKLLPLYIPGDIYKRLEEAAFAEERDPIQQARWILRRALEGTPDLATEQGQPVGAGE